MPSCHLDPSDIKHAKEKRSQPYSWEQRKFFENIKKTIDFRGRTPKKLGMDWSKNGYLALSALNVKNGYIDYFVKTHHASQELYDKWMSGNELKKGQV
ncbi:MAG: restriction endonuclease subunit S, partial [Lactobacillus sp.]|nr:restriction endonuclease subunit S [Lactobacillus sp.]